MLRFLVLTILALIVAIGGGTASVWRALDSREEFGAARIGPWHAVGRNDDTDPYSVARRARTARLPLGIAEGLIFHARSDGEGRALSGDCTYALEGNVPFARFWTLHAADPDLRPFKGKGGSGGLHSRQILRRADSSFEIAVGPEALPGNWLSIPQGQPFTLVLTLFDTPASSTLSLTEQLYPNIRRTGCA